MKNPLQNKLLAQFTNRPVLISEAHLTGIIATVHERTPLLDKLSEDYEDEPTDLEDYLTGFIPPVAKYRVKNGVATVPVHGAIGRGMSEMERLVYGFADIDQIAANVRKAIGDDEVSMIVMDFNTPGGSVAQIPETADLIASSPKPVVAYVDELCASAGMWLACACGFIAATRSAELGSIGVYATIYDVSAFYDAMGVSVEVFKSGKFKAAGVPGTSLTDDQRMMLQESVNETFEDFKSFVKQQRGNVPDEAMQGQCFSAIKAMNYGLCDEIATTRESFLQGIHS